MKLSDEEMEALCLQLEAGDASKRRQWLSSVIIRQLKEERDTLASTVGTQIELGRQEVERTKHMEKCYVKHLSENQRLKEERDRYREALEIIKESEHNRLKAENKLGWKSGVQFSAYEVAKQALEKSDVS